MKIGLVCSQGGHTTEMLQMIDAFEGIDLFLITYRSERVEELRQDYHVYSLSNIGTNPLKLLSSLPKAWRIIRQERPDILISTGSEIAIPFFILTRALRIKTIFIESFCRVYSPSRTGKVIYPLADVFFVQWPQLLRSYGPKARYDGGLL